MTTIINNKTKNTDDATSRFSRHVIDNGLTSLFIYRTGSGRCPSPLRGGAAGAYDDVFLTSSSKKQTPLNNL